MAKKTRKSLGRKTTKKKSSLGMKHFVAHRKDGKCPKGSTEVKRKGFRRCRINGRKGYGTKSY